MISSSVEPAECEGTSRWRAVDPILLQPADGKVLIMSPRAGRRILVDVSIAQLVLLAQHGIPKTDGASLLGWPPARYAAVTQRLAAYGFLVDGQISAETPGPWRYWGPVAWAYHDTSLTNPRAVSLCEQLDPVQDAATLPASFRDFSRCPVLLLPRLSPRSDRRFTEVLESRRTHRRFTSAAVSLEDFSEILRYSFGPLRFADAGTLGVMRLQAAASGGSRHETEAYIYVFNVESVEPGLYVYDALRHGLVAIRAGQLRDELDDLTFNQGPPRSAAFGVVTVALTERMAWKYRHASAYRVLWQNVGCLAQVFSMTCACLDLGSAMTGAVRVEQARAALGLESPADLITFTMCCGPPVLRDDGQPASVPTPCSPFYPCGRAAD